MSSIYSISVKDINGEMIPMVKYQGKVLLIVNTASECGFTPQLKQLEELYQKYKSRGLEILAFPCNDFGGQEPLQGQEVQEFCSLKYKTTFPIFHKVRIKGIKPSEIYAYLGSTRESGKWTLSPKWNFHKYLVDRNGHLVDFFLPNTSPLSSSVISKIEKLLPR